MLLGVCLGGLLLATLVPLPPRPDVAILVGTLTFGLVGVLVGYKSPGATVAEASVAGVLLAALTFAEIRLIEGVEPSLVNMTVGFVTAAALSAIGGWAGEVLQGTYKVDASQKLQWPWIGVGTLLGVMLSVYSVFVPWAFGDVGALGILLFFSASFFIVTFFVAYFSPGVTILEPALAAILIIVIDTGLALFGFSAPFPLQW